MEKIETLKDGTVVRIRSLKSKDLDNLMAFFSSLPTGDRKYLRVDVTNKVLIRKRYKTLNKKRISRLIAMHQDKIIAMGALELPEEEWRKHQGELRLFVAKEFRQKGLGMIMVRELYYQAVQKNVEQIVVQMMRPQTAPRRILRTLGFREELLIPDYVQDMTGKKQDLIIMTCNIKDLWKELEHLYTDSDWQRCR